MTATNCPVNNSVIESRTACGLLCAANRDTEKYFLKLIQAISVAQEETTETEFYLGMCVTLY